MADGTQGGDCGGNGTRRVVPSVEEMRMQKELERQRTINRMIELNDQAMGRMERSRAGGVALLPEQCLQSELMVASDAKLESLGRQNLRCGQPLVPPAMVGAHHLPLPPPQLQQQMMMYTPPHCAYAPAASPQQPPSPLAFYMYQTLMYQQLQQWHHVQQLHHVQQQQLQLQRQRTQTQQMRQDQPQQQQLQQQQHAYNETPVLVPVDQEQYKFQAEHRLLERDIDEKHAMDGDEKPRDEEKPRGDVITLPEAFREDAKNTNVSELLDALDRGIPPKPPRKKRNSGKKQGDQTTTTQKSPVVTTRKQSTKSTTPKTETLATARAAPMEEEEEQEQGGIVPTVPTAAAAAADIVDADTPDEIEKLAATVQLALKEWIQKKGPDYECNYAELCKDIHRKVAKHYDDATCMHTFRENLDTCLGVMIGLGLINKVGAETVVVVSHV